MSLHLHQTMRLSGGAHARPQDGACVMELASMLAGEPFSDHPQSVCPVIGRYLRALNDRLDDEPRQLLIPVAAEVVGTAGGRAVRRRRRAACRERALRDGAGRLGSLDRVLLRLRHTDPAIACAVGLLRRDAETEAIAFVYELIAGGRAPVPQAAPAASSPASASPCA